MRIASTKAIFQHDRPLSPSVCLLFESMPAADLARRKANYSARIDAGLEALGQAAGVAALAPQVAALKKLQQRHP